MCTVELENHMCYNHYNFSYNFVSLFSVLDYKLYLQNDICSLSSAYINWDNCLTMYLYMRNNIKRLYLLSLNWCQILMFEQSSRKFTKVQKIFMANERYFHLRDSVFKFCNAAWNCSTILIQPWRNSNLSFYLICLLTLL